MNKLGESLRLKMILPLAEKIKGLKATYWYRQINEMNMWTKQQVLDWQNQHLRDFVRHAYEHTKYYKELFDSLGLKPEDIETAEDLKKLPILTKDIIRSCYDDFIPDNLSQLPHRQDRTGGTTGEPMRFLTSEDTWGYVTAAKMVAWKTTPYKYGDKFAALGSASILKEKPSLVRRIYDWIRQEYPMNSMSLNNELCQKYIDTMRKEGIHYIYGYASSIYLLAKYAHDNQVDVSFIKGAYTTSENLTSTYRAMIENTFGCRVMDCYGCRDAGVACYEIKPGEYYVGYASIVELIDELEDGTGTAISTNILNLAFPMIRYEYGDMIRFHKNPTEYNGQVIEQVLGRKSDVLRLDNGHVLTSPGFTVLMKKFDIVAYDIQKISGSEVKVKIQVVKNKWTNQQEQVLMNEMQRFVGDGCACTIEYVDYFEPLKNGKRRYFMNDMSNL